MFHESIKSSKGDPKFYGKRGFDRNISYNIFLGPENSKFPHVPEERTNSEKSQKPTSHQKLFDQFGLLRVVQTDLTETQ